MLLASSVPLAPSARNIALRPALRVAAAVAQLGQSNAANLYHELGDAAAEARTRQASAALYAPVAAYKAHIRTQDEKQSIMLRQHASILAGLIMPALGEPVTEAELKSGRLVEYVLLDQTTCGVANLLLILVMFAALLVALRWRFIRGGTGAPLLLLPDAHQSLRVAGYGVLLPLAVYALWTRLPVLGGRELSLHLAWPLAVAQALLLVASICGLTVTLAARIVRTRCETLEVVIPPPSRANPLSAGINCFGYLFGSSRYGLYRGTVARSLIPFLALAIVLITLLTTPYLRATEFRLIRTDPLMAIPSGRTSVGFTAIESRLTERLRSEMLHAAGR